MQKFLITAIENLKPLNLAFKELQNKVPTLANPVAKKKLNSNIYP